MFSFYNLLIPSILFFGLGFFIEIIGSDLKFSRGLINALSLYLIIGVGLHGGMSIRGAELLLAGKSIMAAFLLSSVQTFIAYFILIYAGKFDKFNASAISAHYGSVSLGTFLTAVAFLIEKNVPYESYPTIMLAIMEVPPIIIGVLLAKFSRENFHQPSPPLTNDLKQAQQQPTSQEKSAFREVLTSGSILLLIGSLLIGYIAQPNGLATVKPFFVDMFSGMLCLFLIGMGIETAKRIREVLQMGLFLILFGIFVPLIGAMLGIIIAHFILGFGIGGMVLVAVLGASASYIAAPPVIRMAIPEANPTLYLTLSLGITFPFNVTIGIPLYFYVAQLLVSHLSS